jgi:branched-chain amino acid transport system substrate-binding protein
VRAQLALVLTVIAFLFVVRISNAADEPYAIDVMAPLTGTGTFVGHSQQLALQAIETIVNRTGGIHGRPVKFVVHDDQSNPQVAVQLMNEVIARKAIVVLGSATAASCNAMSALLTKDGPVHYCLTPAIQPPAGSYVFSAVPSSPDYVLIAMRYFRELGWKRMAVLTSTDASGADAERAVDAALALPEFKDVSLVGREHFAPSDVSVTAQLTRIKVSNPQVLLAWTTGTPLGTVLRGATETAFNVPIYTSAGNLTYAQMAQYAQFLPKDLYFSSTPLLARNVVTDKAVLAAIAQYDTGLMAIGVKPDYVPSTAWDAAMLVVDALRKLPANATAAQLRDDLASTSGWAGVAGRYDFKKYPQRGLGPNNAVVVRWDAGRGTWLGVSKPGGLPLNK